jgi:hypothetical protein
MDRLNLICVRALVTLCSDINQIQVNDFGMCGLLGNIVFTI